MSVKMTVSTKIKSVTFALGLIGLPLFFTGCAEQQEDTGDIMTNTENGGEDGSGSGADQGDNDNGDGNDDGGSGSGGDDGGDANDTGAATEGAENGATPSTDPAPAEQTAAAPAPAAAGGAAAPAPPPAAASEQAPITGGRVRYVKEGGAKVTSQPMGGEVVRTLDQGDHPVTWEEGGAYKLGNAMFVPKESMSDQGVPRTSVATGK